MNTEGSGSKYLDSRVFGLRYLYSTRVQKNKGLWKGQQTRPCICLNLMIEDQIEDSGYDYCPPEARAGARPPPPLSRGTAGRLGLN